MKFTHVFPRERLVYDFRESAIKEKGTHNEVLLLKYDSVVFRCSNAGIFCGIYENICILKSV